MASTEVTTQRKIHINVQDNVGGYEVLATLHRQNAEGTEQSKKIADNKFVDGCFLSLEYSSHFHPDEPPDRYVWIRSSAPMPQYVWTSTIVIHEAPGVPFGREVKYCGLIFEVPEQYQGMVNMALLLDSSTIHLTELERTEPEEQMLPMIIIDDEGFRVFRQEEDKRMRLDGDVSKVQTYPAVSGYYEIDEDTGIPIDMPISDDARIFDDVQQPRFLERIDGTYIGLVIRSTSEHWLIRFANPKYGFGAFVVYEGPDRLPQELIANARTCLERSSKTTKKELLKLLRDVVDTAEQDDSN